MKRVLYGLNRARGKTGVVCFACCTGTKVKQADVILLGFPLKWSMTEKVHRNDLTYYASVSTVSPLLEFKVLAGDRGQGNVGDGDRVFGVFGYQRPLGELELWVG